MGRKVVRILQRYPEVAEGPGAHAESELRRTTRHSNLAYPGDQSWMAWLRRVSFVGTWTLVCLQLVTTLIQLFRPAWNILPFPKMLMLIAAGMAVLMVLRLISAAPFRGNPYCEMLRLSSSIVVTESHYRVAGTLFSLTLVICLFALMALGAGLWLFLSDKAVPPSATGGQEIYVQAAKLALCGIGTIIISAGWYATTYSPLQLKRYDAEDL